MPQSEEQWELIGYCIDCGMPIYKAGEEIMYTGKDCRCRLEKDKKDEDES